MGSWRVQQCPYSSSVSAVLVLLCILSESQTSCQAHEILTAAVAPNP